MVNRNCNSKSAVFVGLVVSLFFLPSVWAFPENIRHGYSNCLTCHTSPSGGDMLSPYGRSLSKELMSTWGRDGEEKVGHGLLPDLPEQLLVGGHLRAIQTYFENSAVRTEEAFPMQSQLEAAWTYSKVMVAAAFGVEGGPQASPTRGKTFSQFHFLDYRPNDSWVIRTGKFRIAFGIQNPDHTAFTERDIGFDQDTESYNIEVTRIWNNDEVIASAIAGRPDDVKLERERGGAIHYNHTFAETYQVGMSVYSGENDIQRRKLAGISALLGFTHQFFLLSEFDGQDLAQKSSGTDARGWVNWNKLGYEIKRGVIPYLVSQSEQLDQSDIKTRRDGAGLGMQWLPRPHFDLSAEYQRQRNFTSGNSDENDWAWIQFHYYL